MRKFKVGEKAIITHESGHGFPKGEIVDIVRVYRTTVDCKGTSRGYQWCQYVFLKQLRRYVVLNKATKTI